MSTKILRVGVIGAGGNTRKHHIPKLRAQPDVEIVAVANRSLESSQRAAKELDIPRACATWKEIIEADDLDAVCIGTWPYLHAPATIAALEAGKHVLCEARMAMNADQGRAMLDASRANPHLTAQIVPAPHTLALDATIRKMIGEGAIGELIAVDAQVTVGSDFPKFDSPLHWRQDRDLSGNNIMSMGIWYEAMMRWVGPARTVTALGQSVVNHRLDEAGRRVAMSIPDHIEVLCGLIQGGQLRFSVTTVTGHAPPTTVSIYGTEGTLRVGPGDVGDSGFSLGYGARGDKAMSDVKIPAKAIGGWRVEEEFVNAVRGVEPVTHTDLVTAVKYMEWTDAVASSLETGETVRLLG